MKKIDIVLADGNSSYLDHLTEELSNISGYHVVGRTADGQELLNLIQGLHPSIVVMDVILLHLDGIEVMRKIKAEMGGNKPRVLVHSVLDTEHVVRQLLDLGVDYFMRKPTNTDTVIRRIEMLASYSAEKQGEEYAAEPHDFSYQVAFLLKRLGIPGHLIGYKYLNEAVRMVCEDMSLLSSVTLKVYPRVARKYNATASQVERSIRYAIEAAFSTGNLEIIDQVFGYTVNSKKGKPTNSEFIAMVTDHILLGL